MHESEGYFIDGEEERDLQIEQLSREINSSESSRSINFKGGIYFTKDLFEALLGQKNPSK